jgi:PAS domain S-box-containing protein
MTQPRTGDPDVRPRLEKADDTLRAIRRGDVDAPVVCPSGEQVLQLEGVDAPYRLVVEEMNEGVATVDADQIIQYCNRQFSHLVGAALERAVGARLTTFLLREDEPRFRALLEQAKSGRVDGEVSAIRPDGTIAPLKLSLSLLPTPGGPAVCVIATDLSDARQREEDLHQARCELEARVQELDRTNRDLVDWRAALLNMMEDAAEARRALEHANEELRSEIAERKQAEERRRELEEQFRHAQKLEAIGKLAGGIAHDFNNVLTAILGYCELVLEQVADRPDLVSDVEEIKTAGERAARLTHQLLAFSRKQMAMPRVLDLNDVLDGIEKMLRRLIGEDVVLEIEQAPGLNYVSADSGLIEQVLMNLAVNARDAMPDGGTLRLTTGNVLLDDRFVTQHLGSRAGEYVALTVRDTGSGMTPEVLARVFEPFFTTKGPGNGTGLGLSTVYGIVKQSDGYITVESAPGRGTTFVIYFPRTTGTAESAAEPAAHSETAHGNETILVAEDESFVSRLIRNVLDPRGYQVLEAPNGAAALDIVRRRAGSIDLLVSDLIMPDMTGVELADRIRAVRPGVQVLYITGFVDHAKIDVSALRRDAAFLQKPFTADALATKIRQMLDSPKRRQVGA